MTLTEKAAYIKGLAEGLNLSTESAEGKLISALIDMVTELASAQSDTDEDLEYLNDYIEEIDEDLGAVEEYLLDEMDEDCDCCDDDCDCCDCSDDCDCDCLDCDCLDCCDDEDFDEDEDYYEVVCPGCGETICFDSSIDPENLTCPACNEKFACLCEDDDFKILDDAE